MKSSFAKISFILFFLLSLSGCGKIGDKTASLTLIYGAVAAISFVLLLSYLFFIREKRLWFTVLFVSVSVVNTGYFLLAISPTLSLALNANRIAYLGSVFLPLSMFMIILGVANIRYNKILPWLLLCRLFGRSPHCYFRSCFHYQLGYRSCSVCRCCGQLYLRYYSNRH